MHLYLTIPSLSKKIGGPVTVVQHLSEHLVAAGAFVSIVTAEAERGQSEALPRDPRVKLVRVPARGHGVWRSVLGDHLKTALERGPATKDHTIVHDFGLWLPANHAVASISNSFGISRVCSPCGMLAPWALRHKAWKKKLAWWLYQRRDLSSATLVVATAEPEAKDIRRLLPGKNIALIPNGVEILGSSVEPRPDSANQPRKAVFLGRLHPVKGLMNLVEAWSHVRPAGWQCILAGPDEAGHQAALQVLLRARNLQNDFHFPGLLDDEAKWKLLRQADVFILPSFTENFGVAAAEALACGVPVLTTKGTPWSDLVKHRCGWWVDIGVEPLEAALREATALSPSERQEMGQRGRHLVEANYAWPKIGSDLKEVYEWILGGGNKPTCICDTGR